MSKYISFFIDNSYGMYDSDFNSTIPDNSIELTDEEYYRIINERDGIWTLEDGKVVKIPTPPPPLDFVKSAKIAEIDAACAAAITAGQTSAALGTAHTYPSQPNDQANLTANVLKSIFPVNALNKEWKTYHLCADSSGLWAYRAHTAAQIQQVGDDVSASIMTLLMKNQGLKASVSACATIADVKAVAW